MHRRGWSRPGALLLVALGLPALVLLLVPEGRLRCAEPWVRELSADGAWTLTVCRRPMLFAMPGGSGDAPGWVVLRDREDAIRGVVDLDMVQLYGSSGPISWDSERVMVPLAAELPLRPATGPLTRWFDDRLWRIRAWLGQTPKDSDFR